METQIVEKISEDEFKVIVTTPQENIYSVREIQDSIEQNERAIVEFQKNIDLRIAENTKYNALLSSIPKD